MGLYGWRLRLHSVSTCIFFNNYSVSYGSLGALMILLVWLYATGLAVAYRSSDQRGNRALLEKRSRPLDRVADRVGTLITERPRTDPYVRVYAYGSYEG